MEQLKQCITSQVAIDRKTLEAITSAFEVRQYQKGEFFLQTGRSCREMAFIESGYFRMFDIVEDGREITLWLPGPGRFVTSLSSFVFQTENNWTIQAMTTARVLVLSRERHFELSEQYRQWLEFDNLLLAHSFRLLEKNMFDHLHTTAQQRLENLLEEEPELFQHIPLKYIASMLGITPESLSRLRKSMTTSIS